MLIEKLRRLSQDNALSIGEAMCKSIEGFESKITSEDLLERLELIVDKLMTGQRYDPSWIRPMPLTRKEREAERDEAYTIIAVLRGRLK